MRILIADDDKDLAEFLKTAIVREGFIADVAHDGEAALEQAGHAPYDVILLDVQMPKLDGFGVLKQLRKAGNQAGIIMVTSLGSEHEKLTGLNGGADDYVVKPCLVNELIARIRAVLRRKQPVHADPRHSNVLAAGGLRLDLLKHRLELNGKMIELTKKEFELLAYLMQRPGEVLNKSAILQHLADAEFDRDPNFIEALIHRLRDKISVGGKPLIETVRGVGYRLNA